MAPAAKGMATKGAEETPQHVWVINGRTYDFADWMEMHPGGRLWFTRSYNRDISAAFYGYHKDPSKLEGLLSKYEVADRPTELATKMNVPDFILPDDFDANVHTPQFEWKSSFMESLRERLDTKEMRAAIREADREFEIVSVCILLVHLLLCFPVLATNALPVWLVVPLLVATRTSLAGIGHFHCHRAKDGICDWGDGLFDIQYVGIHLVLFDGHVMLHHLYTETPADVKRTVFNGMVTLPRIWRLPAFTVQKFGQFLTGMWIRWVTFSMEAWRTNPKGRGAPVLKHCEFVLVRSLMILEMIFACYTGHVRLWIAQFVLTVWWNMFLITASHEFGEASETGHCGKTGKKVDWGIFQVEHSLDMYITGFQKVDLFLTAGLGSHRAHHALPYQRSGYANIVSEKALKATCKEYGVEWKAPISFLGTRIWQLLGYYLLKPPTSITTPKGMVAENFSFEAFKTCVVFMFFGFLGEGSI